MKVKKYFIITREQVRTKLSWFDKELKSHCWVPTYASILPVHHSYVMTSSHALFPYVEIYYAVHQLLPRMEHVINAH